MLSARGEESKPVAHPCRGPGGQAGDHQKRQRHPLSAPRETWLAPNVIGAWGVGRDNPSANLAGDDSWVAGIELATASEPPARRPSDLGALPFGRRPQPPLSCNPLLNHAQRGLEAPMLLAGSVGDIPWPGWVSGGRAGPSCFPLRSGFVQVRETRCSRSQKQSERGQEVLAAR